MTPYEKIAELIIQKHILVLGKVIALERAKKSGLDVDEEGKVTRLSGNAVEVLEKLLSQYQELLGPAATYFAKDAALGVIKQNPGIELPAALSG